jgi:hypothetical protein
MPNIIPFDALAALVPVGMTVRSGPLFFTDWLRQQRKEALTLAVLRFETPPGSRLKWIGAISEVGAERRLWGFTITLGYSRMMTYMKDEQRKAARDVYVSWLGSTPCPGTIPSREVWGRGHGAKSKSAVAQNPSQCMIGRCGVIWSSHTASTTRAFRWASERQDAYPHRPECAPGGAPPLGRI